MGNSSILPLLALVFLTVGAALAARWGWRWRRIAIPPTCRRCGYDVSQRPAGVETCSECGADLAAPRAIRTDQLVVNRWVALPATLLAVGAMTVTAFVAIRFDFGGYFRANAPIAWIQALARGDRGPNGDKYRAAWRDRDRSPAYVDHLLDIQDDDTIGWRGGLGDELILSLDGDAMTRAQRDRLVRNFFTTPTFRIRTPVRVGDPLPIVADFIPKAGAKQRVTTRRMLAARADGEAQPNQFYTTGGGLGHDDESIAAKDWGSANLTPGRHRVNVKFKRELGDTRKSNAGENFDSYAAAVEVETTLDVDVLPAETPIGQAVPAPERADEVAASIEIAAAKLSNWQWEIFFRLARADVDRAFVVYARINGVEKRIGDVALAAGKTYWTSGETWRPGDFNSSIPDRATITFVGSGDALARTLDQQMYWPGRIVFEDVPLGTSQEMLDVMNRRKAAATRPYRFEPAQ